MNRYSVLIGRVLVFLFLFPIVSQAQDKYLVIPPSAIRPNTYYFADLNWHATSSEFYFETSGFPDSVFGSAAVYLPAVATVTRMYVVYTDNTNGIDEEITVHLRRQDFATGTVQTLASVSSSSVAASPNRRALKDDTIDSADYAADSIDNEHINWADIDYLGDEGVSISVTPMADDCDNFLANFTGNNLYGGTFLCNATGTCVLPAVTAGMHFTIITVGAIACVIDPNASDSMLTDGVQGGDGENITNTSSAGDIAVVQYLSAAGWLVTTNGWTQE